MEDVDDDAWASSSPFLVGGEGTGFPLTAVVLCVFCAALSFSCSTLPSLEVESNAFSESGSLFSVVASHTAGVRSDVCGVVEMDVEAPFSAALGVLLAGVESGMDGVLFKWCSIVSNALARSEREKKRRLVSTIHCSSEREAAPQRLSIPRRC